MEIKDALHSDDTPYGWKSTSEIGRILVYAGQFCYGHRHVLDDPKISLIYELLKFETLSMASHAVNGHERTYLTENDYCHRLRKALMGMIEDIHELFFGTIFAFPMSERVSCARYQCVSILEEYRPFYKNMVKA